LGVQTLNFHLLFGTQGHAANGLVGQIVIVAGAGDFYSCTQKLYVHLGVL
jgi:hypothetical protein